MIRWGQGTDNKIRAGILSCPSCKYPVSVSCSRRQLKYRLGRQDLFVLWLSSYAKEKWLKVDGGIKLMEEREGQLSQIHFTAHGSDSVSSKRGVLTWPEATLYE